MLGLSSSSSTSCIFWSLWIMCIELSFILARMACLLSYTSASDPISWAIKHRSMSTPLLSPESSVTLSATSLVHESKFISRCFHPVAPPALFSVLDLVIQVVCLPATASHQLSLSMFRFILLLLKEFNPSKGSSD